MRSQFWSLTLPSVLILSVLVLAGSAGAMATSGGPHPAGGRPDRSAAPPPTRPTAAVPPSGAGARPGPQASATLTSTGISPTVLGLTWTAATAFGFGNYTLERSPNGSTGPWTTVAVLTSSTSTAYTDTQLAPGSTAWWQVVSAGLFPETTDVLEVAQPPLSVLNFTTPTSSSVQFNWTNNETYGTALQFGAYILFESIDGGRPSSVTTISAADTTTYTVQGLSSGSSYAFYLNTSDCLSGCGTGTAVDSVTESNLVTFGTPLPLGAVVSPVRSVIDVGQQDLLTCSPSGGVSPFQFAWDSGNGTFVPGGSEVSLSYAAAGPETVTCQVTDAAASHVTASTVLTVDLAPTLTVSTNRSAVDTGQPISFVCSAANGTAPVLLAWAFGDGAQTSGGLTDHTYASAGTFLAACSGVDATDTVVQASTTIVSSPPPNVTAASSSARAAPGSILTFHATASNGSGSYSNFTWTFGDGTRSYTSTSTHAYATASSDPVVVTVTDSNGGRAIATTSVVISNVVSGATVDRTSVSTGGAVAFGAVPSGGAGGPYNVTWTFGDGASAYGTNVTHAYPTGGDYDPSVVVTDALGAKNTTALPSVTVTVPPTPGPWFTEWDALLLLLLLVLVAIIVVVVVRRRRSEAQLAKVQGRIPPTDPNEVAKGARVCRNCGTSNLPLRESCVNCGHSLRRSPF